MRSSLFAGFFLVATVAVALAGKQETKARPGGRFAGGDWRQGEILYRQNCAMCHSANLQGRCMAPSLVGVTRHMTDDAIVAHARMIGEKMCCARHIRKLSDDEFADIIAFFHAVDENLTVRQRAAGGRGGCCGR